MSDCFVLYLLLTCMKKKTSGADKFTNNNAPIFSWFEESPTLFSTQHRLQLLISRIRLY